MNLVRQAIAMSIILYAFKYIKNKDYLKVAISVFIASLFHNSSLIMIPIILLGFLNITGIKKIIISGLVMLLQPIILKIALWILSFTKYIWYYEQGLYTESISILLLVQNIFIFALDLYYQRIYKNKITKEYKILSNINFIGLCSMILASNVPLIFRIVRYCTIFQILFIPKILNLSDKKENKVIFTLLIYAFMVVCMIYQIIICGGEGVYPYSSIFGNIIK